MHNILLPWTESQLQSLGHCGHNNIVVISVSIYGKYNSCARLRVQVSYVTMETNLVSAIVITR